MIWIRQAFLGFWLFPLMLFSQQPSGVIEVSGRIIQKGNLLQSHDDLELYVVDYGSVEIENNGVFNFKAPKGLDLRIEIIPSEYKVMRPLDGFLQGETKSYQIEIIILHATQDSLLKSQIAELDTQVKRLQEENQLSTTQIEKLDQQILDTVLYFEGIQSRFQQKIRQLESRLDEATGLNQALTDSLKLYRSQMTTLNDSIIVLIDQLAMALEEQYLRMKGHYDRFSQLVLDYQTKLKDLNDFLPQIENCYRHAGALNQFNELGKAYSQSRDALYAEHEEHLQGIRHYWEPESYDQAQMLCQYIFNDIHDALVLQELNANILPHLKAYATKGTRKVKETRKAGEQLHEALNPKIEALEEHMEITFTLLSKAL